MSVHRSLRASQGFLLLTGLFIMTGLLTFTAVGLTRSMTELRAANRFVYTTQSFHLAEAGLDQALDWLSVKTHTQLNNYLTWAANPGIPKPFNTPDGPICPAGLACSITVQNDPGEGGVIDNNHTILVRATGQSSTSTHTIEAMVQLPQSVFDDDGLMAWDVRMPPDTSKVMLGDSTNPISVFTMVGFHPDLTDEVWASYIQSYVDANSFVCPLCGPPQNTSVFPNDAPIIFGNSNWNRPVYPPEIGRFDLNPYWEAASEQSGTDCQGQNYHHITSGTLVIDGSACPGGVQVLDGIIYVEKEANLELAGNVILHGTIAHEGHSGIHGGGSTDSANPYKNGLLKIRDGANVTIDSYAGTDPSFQGAAIVGQPLMLVEGAMTRFTAKGIVMAGGEVYGPTDDRNNPPIFGGQTTIDGVLMSMCDTPFTDIVPGVDGPGISDPIAFWSSYRSFHDIVMEDEARLVYEKPRVIPAGFYVMPRNGHDDVRRPTVIYWRQVS